MPAPGAIAGFSRYLKVVVFLSVICVPAVRTMMAPQAALSGSEKRKLAELPRIEMSARAAASFPGEFEAYLNDHFGFRRQLIQAFNYLQVTWLHRSPEEQVVLGRDGWLYFSGDRSLEDYRGLIPLTEEQLARARLILENRRDWLADQGVCYLFVVAPNKHSIYPEFLPGFFSRRPGKTRFDQFLEYMQETSDLAILDLRRPLRAAKSDELLYLRSDTHWNPRGVFLAYRKIMERVNEWFPEARPLTPGDLIEQSTVVPGGDLAQMLDLRDLFREPYPFMSLKHPCAGERPEVVNLDPVRAGIPVVPGEASAFCRGCDRSSLRGLVFRDSFFVSMELFLSEHFGQIDYVWTRFDRGLVETYLQVFKPDIIIDETVERSFITALGLQSSGLDGLARERFGLLDERIVNYRGGPFPGLGTYGDLSVEPQADGLVLHCRDYDPQLWLPEMKATGAGASVMRIRLTAPAATVLQVFWSTEDPPRFREENSVTQSVRQGLNEIYIEIPAGSDVKALRVDPGVLPGRYVLHELEWRMRSGRLLTHGSPRATGHS